MITFDVFLVLEALVVLFVSVLDMNECAYDGYCEQTCVNTVGSFTCGCISGYTLHNDTMCAAVNGALYKFIQIFSLLFHYFYVITSRLLIN